MNTFGPMNNKTEFFTIDLFIFDILMYLFNPVNNNTTTTRG